MICPTCRKKVTAGPDLKSNPFRPFCSERCRLADLGAWLDGTHRISEPLSEEELDQSLPTEGSESETEEAQPLRPSAYKLGDRSGRN